jgi:hypothetical protein
MGFSTYTERNVLAVRWHTLEHADIAALIERARAQHRREGRKLLYLGVQYNDTPLPSGAVTKQIVDRSADLFGFCDSIYLVVSATGLAASLHRTALRTMMTMARLARLPDADRALVLDSIDDALSHAGAALPLPAARLRAAMTAAGIP